jgi:REP element-mobilizing transposase RayT
MGYPLRIADDGAIYHVVTRGNNKRAIFEHPTDRRAFLELLDEVAPPMRWVGYAYCVMGNHMHLVVRTDEANISEGMRQILGRYAREHNRRTGRTGHVFGDAFEAISWRTTPTCSLSFATSCAIRSLPDWCSAPAIGRQAATTPRSSQAAVRGSSTRTRHSAYSIAIHATQRPSWLTSSTRASNHPRSPTRLSGRRCQSMPRHRPSSQLPSTPGAPCESASTGGIVQP